MERKTTFAARLNEGLALRNLTKAELSRRTGINKANITHYAKGEWEPKPDAGYRIARALNVPASWLYGYGI